MFPTARAEQLAQPISVRQRSRLHCSPAERLEQVALLIRPRGPCLAAAAPGPMAIAAEPQRPAAARAAAAPMMIAARLHWGDRTGRGGWRGGKVAARC